MCEIEGRVLKRRRGEEYATGSPRWKLQSSCNARADPAGRASITESMLRA